jgi:hypothetical protein
LSFILSAPQDTWICSLGQGVGSCKVVHPSNIKNSINYARNDASALHGIVILLQLEQIMIKAIHNNLQAYNRTEKLVILDGALILFNQPALSLVPMEVDWPTSSGSHGGGLANLLFTAPTSSCQERPKVLKLLKNPLTPKVQDGYWFQTYCNLYSTFPCMEYHDVKVIFRPVDMNAHRQ